MVMRNNAMIARAQWTKAVAPFDHNRISIQDDKNILIQITYIYESTTKQ